MKSVLVPMLLAVSFTAHAQNARIAVEPALPTAGQPFNLVISGQWPDGCGAAIRSQTLSGKDITIEMERPRGQICTQAVVNYSLPINPFKAGTFAEAGTYRVRYQLYSEGESTRLLAFTLVAVGSPTTFDFRPEAGNWVAEPGGEYATSGTGVSVAMERQGATLVAMTNFFDSAGKAEWLFAAGPYANGAAAADLTRVAGGQALFSTYRSPQSYEPSGKLLVEFASPAQATLWFVQPEGDGFLDNLKLMPISMIPFRSVLTSVYDSFTGSYIYTTANDSSARQYRFSPIRFGARDVVGWEDQGQTVQLRCGIDSTKERTLPSRCELSRDGNLLATFTAVGHDALIGTDTQGRQVRLTRGD